MSPIGPLATMIALGALLSTGCAAQLKLTTRDAVGGGPLLAFWPPPEATSTWSAAATNDETSLGASADRIATTLESAGYTDLSWYAIGAHYAHGFAVSTKLEKVGADGGPDPGERRFSSLFPEASNLFWLEAAREMRLPGPGRYRVFLLAFTDLPIGPSHRAPHRNEQTWMDVSPRAPSGRGLGDRRVSSDYRIGAYVYEYASDAADGAGAFVPIDDELPPASHLRMSGLSTIVRE